MLAPPLSRWSRWLLVLAAAALPACRLRPGPEQEPSAAAASASAVALAVSAALPASASAELPASDPAPAPTGAVFRVALDAGALPTLFPETVLPAVKDRPFALSVLDNAAVVAQGSRVGRLHEGKIEWLPQPIPEIKELGKPNAINVLGHWPDSLDLILASREGRQAYVPLTGQGTSFLQRAETRDDWRFPASRATFLGMGQVGETRLVMSHDPLGEGTRLIAVRGPAQVRSFASREDEHCLVRTNPEDPTSYLTAVSPGVFGATRAGTTMMVGEHCDSHQYTAEVWDREGKSHLQILPLSQRYYPGTLLLPGAGDELWIVPEGSNKLVHYQDGLFSPFNLPAGSEPPLLSPEGQLLAHVYQVIYRQEGNEWRPFTRFFWPLKWRKLTFDGKVFWGLLDGALVRYREGPTLDFHPGCQTPFLYLSTMSREEWRRYYVPRLKKKMAATKKVIDLKAVEFQESGLEHFGLVARTEEQARAIMALLGTLPGVTSRLLCYAPRASTPIP